MTRLTRMTPLAAVTLLLLLHVADLRAGQALKLSFVGPEIYCLFDASCTVTPIETQSTFSIPGMTGQGILVTRTFAASPGSPADGYWGYEYRIDLTNVTGTTGLNCVEDFRIKLGSLLATLDYDDDGVAGDHVYMVGPFATSIIVTQAIKDGPFVTFHFGVPVCPGETPQTADRSVLFGVVAGAPPRSVLADLQTEDGGLIQTGTRAPNLSLKFSFTLLYDTIVTLPPNGFIAPTANAGEGRRESMLNRVNAALALAEGGNVLPAVQLLERLLELTDGDAHDWVQDDPETRGVDERLNLYGIIQELIEMLQRDPESA